MPIELQFPDDELRTLKLLFADGLDDAKHKKDAHYYELIGAIAQRVENMKADEPASFSIEDIELLAKAVDLGRDKEDSLIHDKRVAGDLATIDRVLARLVASSKH